MGLEHLQPRALDRHIARVFPGLRSVDLSLCPPLQAGQATALCTMPHLTSLRATHIVPAQLLGVATEIAQLKGLISIDFTGYGPAIPCVLMRTECHPVRSHSMLCR